MGTLFRDWRQQLSWGRVCAAVALVVAVWREFGGASVQHVALWLGVATGSYGTSKFTEIVALLKGFSGVGVSAPPARGTESDVWPSPTEATGAQVGGPP